jgi:hypothetical protein
MSAHEPRRILSAGSEASPALKRLMRSAAHDGPSAEQVSHLEDRLQASFAVGIAAGAGVKAAVAAKATSAWTAWIAVAAVSASVSGGAALYVRSRTPSRATAVGATAVRAHPLPEPVLSPPPAVAAPPVLPRHPAPSHRTVLARGPGSTPAPEADTPAIPFATPAPLPVAKPRVEDAPAPPPESTLLAEAFRALHAGDARAALQWAARHAQEYPRGEMAQERDAISIEALVKLGRSEEARRSLASFKELYPSSGYAWRLEALVSQ